MHADYPFAFATFLIVNDSYLPGALIQAYELRRQGTLAAIICFITESVSRQAGKTLSVLFDKVVRVEPLTVDTPFKRKCQYLPFVFTRLHALRMGRDGDLRGSFEKIVVMDADILPLRHSDHLFLLETPAGILNEDRESFKGPDNGTVRNETDESVLHGRWYWHNRYRDYPHGHAIPGRITDRVGFNTSNCGMNTALMVIKPDFAEYRAIKREISAEPWRKKIAGFRWPDMQYLTLRWSGTWRNIDICFAGMNGYPHPLALNGLHFAGLKPWNVNNRSVASRYSFFPDFIIWYREFAAMMESFPVLKSVGKLKFLYEFARNRADCAGNLSFFAEARLTFPDVPCTGKVL